MKMTRLIPMLPVRSMPASVEFYSKLGFSVEKRNDEWHWAMLSFDECRVMVDESINISPSSPRLGVLYLYPDDVAEYHKQLRENGLDVPALEESFYGMSEFRIDESRWEPVVDREAYFRAFPPLSPAATSFASSLPLL